MYVHKQATKIRKHSIPIFYAANGSEVKSFGQSHKLTWNFYIGDVTTAIIGSDF